MLNNNVMALFVDAKGIYPELLGQWNCWTGKAGIPQDDARRYQGPYPVVAHPPCQLWVNLAAVNYARAITPCIECDGVNSQNCDWCESTGRKEPNRRVVLPAWYPGGHDEGCFESALRSVRTYGGVLEHPAFTHAWEKYNLVPPNLKGWSREYWPNVGPCRRLQHYWVCEVWQSAYDGLCQKRTWLLYCGKRPPFDLDWSHKPGTHQVGWFDRNKPTVGKRQASATPKRFAETLISLAEWSRNE